jgi:hypothetical protein
MIANIDENKFENKKVFMLFTLVPLKVETI